MEPPKAAAKEATHGRAVVVIQVTQVREEAFEVVVQSGAQGKGGLLEMHARF